jgi:hypothetical protein
VLPDGFWDDRDHTDDGLAIANRFLDGILAVTSPRSCPDRPSPAESGAR